MSNAQMDDAEINQENSERADQWKPLGRQKDTLYIILHWWYWQWISVLFW